MTTQPNGLIPPSVNSPLPTQNGAASQNKPPPEGLEVGIDSMKRLEPDLTPLPMDYMIMSIAVSLKGINDNLFSIKNGIEAGNFGQRDSLAAIKNEIANGLKGVQNKVSDISSTAHKLLNSKVFFMEEHLKQLRGY